MSRKIEETSKKESIHFFKHLFLKNCSKKNKAREDCKEEKCSC